ncbi:MAG: ABC transporter permease [Verrucomicrobiota bacterium]
MQSILTIFKREFLGYFRSPVAYVFLIVFLVASIVMAWFVGRFFDANNASLSGMFNFFPYIFVVFIPAVGMRLWAEERKSGTWELLFTLPISTTHAVIGKFLAAWLFITITIAMTFTMPITVGYLGDPDWGLIFSGYLASVLMAGIYLSICSLMSAVTKNQVIAFVLGFIACLIMILMGYSILNNLIDFLPVAVLDAIGNISFMPHYMSAVEGIVTISSFIYFISFTALGLLLNIIVLER